MAAKPKDAPLTDSGALYSPRDFKAGAQAVEKDTDSAWLLWMEANKTEEELKADPRYQRTLPQALKTQPAGLAPTAPPRRKAARLKHATVEEAMVEVRRNNRVCPRPKHWQDMYELLPPGNDLPDPPLVGPAWNTTASINKRTLLRKQLEWAAEHGQLDRVMSFLESLPEPEWFHMDD